MLYLLNVKDTEWGQEGGMKRPWFSSQDVQTAAARHDERGSAAVPISTIKPNGWWQKHPTKKNKKKNKANPEALFLTSNRSPSRHVPQIPALWSVMVFRSRLQKVFSPFPCWWWRKCLLWPLVWWCTLHLHNVSVKVDRTKEWRNRIADMRRGRERRRKERRGILSAIWKKKKKNHSNTTDKPEEPFREFLCLWPAASLEINCDLEYE